MTYDALMALIEMILRSNKLTVEEKIYLFEDVCIKIKGKLNEDNTSAKQSIY